MLLTTASSPAQPRLGAIRGRVRVLRVEKPPERRPSVSELGAPPPREIPDLRRAVVYLEKGPAAALESREPVRARMDQRNETFLPHVLAVDAGTLVDFPNNDSTYHNVFSLSKTKKFDLGRYARGKSKIRLVRSAGRRAHLLRYPLAYERVRARVQSSVLRDRAAGWPVPHRQHPSRHLLPCPPGMKAKRATPERSPSPRRAATSTWTSSSHDAGCLVADEPDLPGVHAVGGPGARVLRSISSTPGCPRKRKRTSAAAQTRPRH